MELSADAGRLDRDLIHRFLSTEAYWAAGRTRGDVDRAIDASVCVGAYDEDGAQVGFARAVTDTAFFAYLADVFVVAEHRGSGVGRALVGHLLDLPELEPVRRVALVTRDAHDLHRRFGFAPLGGDPSWMVRQR